MVTAQQLADCVWDEWEVKKAPDNVRLWTRRMNRRLEREARGLVASYSAPKRKKAEYLVDHSWAWTRRRLKTYRGLALAAEFEFGGTVRAIADDLVKLVDVRAYARLFVGNIREWTRTRVQEIAEATKSMLQRHEFARNDWIVLAIGPKGERASKAHRIRIWKVTRSRAQLLYPRGDKD